ncbi:MAG: hypothetical protein LBT50_01110 [Prevotellaceae bacterium]|jgi:hypothetical protein|nr:hypothetical protein [Prevotellaceae bacterium]
MTRLTALELATNYPDNILITSYSNEGKFGILCYMTRNGEIHKLMISSEPVYESKEKAEETMHNIIKNVLNDLEKYF